MTIYTFDIEVTGAYDFVTKFSKDITSDLSAGEILTQMTRDYHAAFPNGAVVQLSRESVDLDHLFFVSTHWPNKAATCGVYYADESEAMEAFDALDYRLSEQTSNPYVADIEERKTADLFAPIASDFEGKLTNLELAEELNYRMES